MHLSKVVSSGSKRVRSKSVNFSSDRLSTLCADERNSNDCIAAPETAILPDRAFKNRREASMTLPQHTMTASAISVCPIFDYLDRAAAKFSDSPAIEFLGRRWTYGALGKLVDRAARGRDECLSGAPVIRPQLSDASSIAQAACFKLARRDGTHRKAC